MAGSEGMSGSGDDSSSGDTPSTHSSSASATETTLAETSTSGPIAECGDGQLGPGEECDDGGLGGIDDIDGCYECKRDRIVFATSLKFSSQFIGGLAGADGICLQRALAGELERPEGFKAWLSDSKNDAIERVFSGEGRYVRVDGALVAYSMTALLAGDMKAPIEIDEFGGPAGSGAWTGTMPNGRRVADSKHCLDWTTDDPFTETGYYGICIRNDESWTFEDDPVTSPGLCSEQFRLYCFEGE